MAAAAAHGVLLLAAVLVSLPALSSSASTPITGCFPRFFCLSDSLDDTGNLIKHNTTSKAAFPPYGVTFGRPTGRFTDGRVIVDYIAEAIGLPLLPPYLDGSKDNFLHGVNYGYAGAEAANTRYGDLPMQWTWFKDSLKQMCGDEAGAKCKEMMATSLFIVEIGGNDYNHPIMLAKKPLAEVKTYVPKVITAVATAVEGLLKLGAKTILVPGNMPIGCHPKYLTAFLTDDKSAYEPDTGCLRIFNEFGQFHSTKIKEAIDSLRSSYPDANIIYVDFYASFMNAVMNSKQFGMDFPLKACCGGEGPYGFSMDLDCGMKQVKPCDDPSKYGSWDGVHPSQAMYKAMVEKIIDGTYATPTLQSVCATRTKTTGDEKKEL